MTKKTTTLAWRENDSFFTFSPMLNAIWRSFSTQSFEVGSQNFMTRNDDLSHTFLSQTDRRAKKSSFDKTMQRYKNGYCYSMQT